MGQREAIVTIRSARPEDLASLPAIERAAGTMFPAERIPDPESTYPAALLREAVEEGLLLVAELADTVVGFAACRAEANYLHLDELSVHPDYGRRGIGRSLVSAVRALSARRGLVGTTLTTFADIPWNGPFYERIGFTAFPTGAAPDHVESRLAEERAHGLSQRVGMVVQNSDEAW